MSFNDASVRRDGVSSDGEGQLYEPGINVNASCVKQRQVASINAEQTIKAFQARQERILAQLEKSKTVEYSAISLIVVETGQKNLTHYWLGHTKMKLLTIIL